MSGKGSTKSSAATWIAVMLAVAAIYVLTVPPIFCMAVKQAMGRTTASIVYPSSTPLDSSSSDAWVSWYELPYFLLSRVPVLDKPLKGYLQWWIERSGLARQASRDTSRPRIMRPIASAIRATAERCNFCSVERLFCAIFG
jgi:hypothetical protein